MSKQAVPRERGDGAGAVAPNLSDAQLAQLLGLIDEADSVELKLTIPASGQRAAVEALGLDPLQAQIRQVFFFDTPDLQLDRAGLVVRARRVQKRGDDTVVKLRPVDPDALPAKVRRAPGFNVEVDAMPGGFVCSGSMKGALDAGPVKAVMTGRRPLRKLFSKEQRAFFKAHAPAGIELDDLSPLGPIFVLKLKSYPPGHERRLVSELWLYPDGSRVMELSTRCSPRETFEVAAKARVFLTSSGLDLTGEQQAKTRKALDFFSAAAG
jgi:hypothetical protein